jgi:type II secretory pathway pseudopilin PulG
MDLHRWTAAVGLMGILATVAIPVIGHERRRRAEDAAAAVLTEVARAQTAFRSTGGHGGYASDLDSLINPCPGTVQSTLLEPIRASHIRTMRYAFLARAAGGSRVVATDCHGRPSVSDYYAAATPRVNGVDGQRAFAMRSSGQVYVFFDGVAPRETDMGPFGLAVALNTLDRFKIP